MTIQLTNAQRLIVGALSMAAIVAVGILKPGNAATIVSMLVALFNLAVDTKIDSSPTNTKVDPAVIVDAVEKIAEKTK